ncbi:MAG: heavy-metal-associated domain-containing protein [Oligoflexia bacterium]|nr:heavy-metal-associated domain-containing protein [Oligoflexia bacterium]
MSEIRIPVQGMTCGGCTASVERALSRVPGVDGSSASVKDAAVVVRFDPQQVAPDQLVQVIVGAGYEVPAQNG